MLDQRLRSFVDISVYHIPPGDGCYGSAAGCPSALRCLAVWPTLSHASFSMNTPRGGKMTAAESGLHQAHVKHVCHFKSGEWVTLRVLSG
jgi:hypothetical protein